MHKVSLLLASSWRYQPCTASSSDAGTERQVLGKHTSESPPQSELLLIDAWVPATTSLSMHFILVKLFATLIYYFLLFIILLLLIKIVICKGLTAKSSFSFLQTGVWLSVYLLTPLLSLAFDEVLLGILSLPASQGICLEKRGWSKEASPNTSPSSRLLW